MEKKKIVKQNSSFIEYPLWNVDRQSVTAIYEIQTKQGKYTYKAMPDNVPDDIDALFLYYMLFVSQDTHKTNLDIKTSQVLKELDLQYGSQSYNRFATSLDRWKDVSVKFEGTFYIKEKKKNAKGQEVTVKRHVTKGFHILEYEHTKKSEEVEDQKTKGKRKYKTHEFNVQLNKKFIEAINDAGLIRYIDLQTFIKLKKPITRRLYEWLPKQFIKESRKIFQIRHEIFFEKMRITCPKYISHIKRKLKKIDTAIVQINKYEKRQEYRVSYEEKKDSSGKYILISFARKTSSLPQSKTQQKGFKVENKEVHNIQKTQEEEDKIFEKIAKLPINKLQELNEKARKMAENTVIKPNIENEKEELAKNKLNNLSEKERTKINEKALKTAIIELKKAGFNLDDDHRAVKQRANNLIIMIVREEFKEQFEKESKLKLIKQYEKEVEEKTIFHLKKLFKE
ncbi:MAG: replication initiation protein [bacterium]|nr:replication initiation protein [bacterium]